MTKRGIDVSLWNGQIDFNKVKKSGIDFVIIRAGYGQYINHKDPMFETNYAKAREANLDIGSYWYSYAESTADAKKEAETCMEAIKGKKFEYPIYFDVEEDCQTDKGKSFCSSIVETFCNTLQSKRYFCGLYMCNYDLCTYITNDVAKKYSLWIANYSNEPNFPIPYGLWQYTSQGNVDGINGYCDMNHTHIDYPSIIISKGFNGYEDKKSQ